MSTTDGGETVERGRVRRVVGRLRRYPVLSVVVLTTALIEAGQPPGLPLPFSLLVSFLTAIGILVPIALAIDVYRIRYVDGYD